MPKSSTLSLNLSGNTISFNSGQFKNAERPISVTLSGIVIDVNPVALNANIPMLVTLSGIVIDVKLMQPANAKLPILVTPSDIVIEVKLMHS